MTVNRNPSRCVKCVFCNSRNWNTLDLGKLRGNLSARGSFSSYCKEPGFGS